jgi:ubiquitin-protein ligase
MVLTKTSVQRIAKDVKYIINNPIINIYYKHDTENITKGYALILGNEDTPYCHGNYLFEFTFPDNYPYEPPKLKFLTNDNSMRFHPNLYINGKVCLSIINTWNGEGWTSCNNINSILLSLISIFDKNSLTFEPGIQIDHHNVKKYDILVGFKNIEFTIVKQIKLLQNLDENKLNSANEKCLFLFKDIIINNFKKNLQNINNNLQNLKEEFNKKQSNLITISSYSLNFNLDFDKLTKDLNNLSKI